MCDGSPYIPWHCNNSFNGHQLLSCVFIFLYTLDSNLYVSSTGISISIQSFLNHYVKTFSLCFFLIYLIYVYVRRTWQSLLLSAPSSSHLLGLDFRRYCRSDMLALCTARLYLISYQRSLHRLRICYHATLPGVSPLLHTCLARTVVVPISARRMALWGRKLWAILLLRV